MTPFVATPVVLFVYNRPIVTAKVFQAIRLARPQRLFVVADGARPGRTGDEALVNETRRITEEVDWPCEVVRDYSHDNLGCGRRVSTGMNWVFRQCQEAIILEDDCVPVPTFFQFCETMLALFRDDERIMHVAGTNYASTLGPVEHTYFFSRYYAIWGWATWRRAWAHYDFTISKWPLNRSLKALDQFFGDAAHRDHHEQRFDAVREHGLDTWDIQWDHACIFNHGLAVVPRNNLVTNIGEVGHFSDGKTGSYRSILFKPAVDIDLATISHPAQVCPDPVMDRRIFEVMAWPARGLAARSVRRIRRALDL